MRISDWSSDVCSSDLSSVPAITQNPDIRYLGRLLGDVIRAYGGEKIYKQTEYIRSASVDRARRSEAHTSELQSLMRNPYAVFCLTNKNIQVTQPNHIDRHYHYIQHLYHITPTY